MDQIDYLLEMGEILGLENWFTYGATCFAHPLRFDRHVADKFVRRVREGDAAGFTAMPVAGVTTPVSVERSTAVAAAEIVATWMVGRALNPACGLGGSMWSATVDMRTGAVSYACFDALFHGFVCCEFIRLWTGHGLPVSGGGAGIQALRSRGVSGGGRPRRGSGGSRRNGEGAGGHQEAGLSRSVAGWCRGGELWMARGAGRHQEAGLARSVSGWLRRRRFK